MLPPWLFYNPVSAEKCHLNKESGDTPPSVTTITPGEEVKSVTSKLPFRSYNFYKIIGKFQVLELSGGFIKVPGNEILMSVSF